MSSTAQRRITDRTTDQSVRREGDARSWIFFGSPNSAINRLYDWLRRGLNARLVRFLHEQLHCTKLPSPSVGVTEPVRTLEAGCGTAYASTLLAQSPGVDASVCLDIDEDALREAKRRDPSLPAVVGDLTQMPFAEGAFSLVFNSSTVEHLPDPSIAVAEMNRVCHADGHVFVGVPYRYGPLGFQPLIGRTKLGEWLGPVFSRASLERMLKEQGIKPIRHLRYFLRFFTGSVGTKQQASSRQPV